MKKKKIVITEIELNTALKLLSAVKNKDENAKNARLLLSGITSIIQENLDSSFTGPMRVSPSLLALLPECCPGLVRLDLSGTDLADISFLEGLLQLQDLSLNETRVSDLKAVKGLKQLKSLSLDETLITDISYLSELSQLNVLSLNETRISKLMPLKGLSQLQSLSLNGTEISDLSVLSKLLQLRALSLNETHVSDISHLAGLLQLQILLLNETGVTQLLPLKGLSNLQSLAFNRTNVKDLSPLSNLEKLEELSLNETKVTDLNALEKLSSLKVLLCSGLHLERVPRFCLREGLFFSIDDTTISQQPTGLFNLPKDEILATYYNVDRIAVNEGKVIFLGESGAGKTHTIERIKAAGRQIDYRIDTTPGVMIRPFERNEGPNIKFWDFGGQDIVQSMHHCFLTERSCYVIVVGYRDSTKAMGEAEKWLRTVAGYSRGVSVLLAVNRWHGANRAEKNIDEAKLRQLCPTLAGVVYYSAFDDEEEDFYKNITSHILQEVEKLDSVKLELPPAWAAIRDEMRSMREDYISLGDYLQICVKHGLGGEDAAHASIRTWLLDWFNDLGICFSYHQNQSFGGTALDDFKVLNPKWLTNGVYRILWNGSSFSGGGILHKRDFDKLLTDPNLRSADSSYRYEGAEREYILEIMRKFQRAYLLSADKIFIPELLEGRPPVVQGALGERQLTCYWKLTYLPIHLLHRIMIAMYDYHDGVIWRYGIRFKLGDAYLLLEARPDERLLFLSINLHKTNGEDKHSALFCKVRELLLESVEDMRLILEDERIYANWNGAIIENGLSSIVEKYWKDSRRIVNNTDGKDWEFTVAELLEPLFGSKLLHDAKTLSSLSGSTPMQALDDVISVLPYSTQETIKVLHAAKEDLLQGLGRFISISVSSVQRYTRIDINTHDFIVLLGLLKRRAPGFATWLRENGVMENINNLRENYLKNKIEAGINRDLLCWAVESPLYKAAVGSADPDYEDLLKALSAYDDDRYQGSLALMNAIWKNHTDLGLPPDYDHLTELEFDRKFYPKYRDHTTHMFKVFLLGLYLYENHFGLRNAIGSVGLDATAFLSVWILTALFHDVGYVIENDSTSGDDAAAALVFQRLTKSLSQPLTNLFPEVFGVGTEKGILEGLDIHAPHIERIQSLKRVLKRFNGKGKSVRLTVREDDNPILIYFEQRQGKHEGRSYFDHGIVSAGILLFIQQALCEYYDHFHEEELNSDQRNKLRDLRSATPAYKCFAERAAFAVALHNINKDWNGEQLVGLTLEGIRLGDFRIPLDIELEPGFGPEPIAWLLRLCDELQCWDRQYYSSPIGRKTSLHGNTLHFQGEDDSLELKISDSGAKDSISAALADILTPSFSEIIFFA